METLSEKQVKELVLSPTPFRNWLNRFPAKSRVGNPRDFRSGPISNFLKSRGASIEGVGFDEVFLASGQKIPLCDVLVRFSRKSDHLRVRLEPLTVADCLKVLNEIEQGLRIREV